jgi:cysteine desulfurase
MRPFAFECFGNPSSVHAYGQATKQAVDTARQQVHAVTRVCCAGAALAAAAAHVCCREQRCRLIAGVTNAPLGTRTRTQVAALINCWADELAFTSCGTESDNCAIWGTVMAAAAAARASSSQDGSKQQQGPPHVVTSAIEHPAITNCLQSLQQLVRAVPRGMHARAAGCSARLQAHAPLRGCRHRVPLCLRPCVFVAPLQGLCTYTAVPVSAEGLVAPGDVLAALTPSTVLVTIMHSNNEVRARGWWHRHAMTQPPRARLRTQRTRAAPLDRSLCCRRRCGALHATLRLSPQVGAIQPVGAITAAVKAAAPRVLVHTDAAQSMGRLDVDVKALGVDMLTLVGHKFGAPKGVAALFIKCVHGLLCLCARVQQRVAGGVGGAAACLLQAAAAPVRLQAAAATRAHNLVLKAVNAPATRLVADIAVLRCAELC